MDTVSKEYVREKKNVAIVGYVTCIPILIYCSYVLIRVFVTRSGLKTPAIICSLLIIYNVLMMALTQSAWTEMKNDFESGMDINLLALN
jgi:hypothetical protein